MRGDVLHYDEAQGFGFIDGADGNRYTFAREDLRHAVTASKGVPVEFQPSGGQAREVFVIRAASATASPEPVAATVPQHFGRFALEPISSSTGLWSYFRRALTESYANFRGRARRKEYWGFYLFWAISVVVLSTVGFAIDGSLGAGLEEPIAGLALPGLFVLAALLSCIAMTVRRIHDLGLSGWFCLLILLPYVGGLSLLVFSLLPSQKSDNRWGPVPAGVKVPAPHVPAA